MRPAPLPGGLGDRLWPGRAPAAGRGAPLSRLLPTAGRACGRSDGGGTSLDVRQDARGGQQTGRDAGD